MDRLIVTELIQHDLTTEKLTAELKSLLTDENIRKQLAQDYKELHNILAQEGNASAKAADLIIEELRS